MVCKTTYTGSIPVVLSPTKIGKQMPTYKMDAVIANGTKYISAKDLLIYLHVERTTILKNENDEADREKAGALVVLDTLIDMLTGIV